MINTDFKKETDALIERVKARGIKLENGNVLVAKVKVDTKIGSIHLADGYTSREDNKQGFGRILALPGNLGLSEGDAKLKVGDYIIYSHEARYLPYVEAVREVLGTLVEEKFIFAVQDSEIVLHIPVEALN